MIFQEDFLISAIGDFKSVNHSAYQEKNIQSAILGGWTIERKEERCLGRKGEDDSQQR